MIALCGLLRCVFGLCVEHSVERFPNTCADHRSNFCNVTRTNFVKLTRQCGHFGDSPRIEFKNADGEIESKEIPELLRKSFQIIFIKLDLRARITSCATIAFQLHLEEPMCVLQA